jgi:hypothetical protein
MAGKPLKQAWFLEGFPTLADCLFLVAQIHHRKIYLLIAYIQKLDLVIIFSLRVLNSALIICHQLVDDNRRGGRNGCVDPVHEDIIFDITE